MKWGEKIKGVLNQHVLNAFISILGQNENQKEDQNKTSRHYNIRQAGAELCQAQVKLG